jgi:hypothetical protein
VEYRITALGRTLDKPFAALNAWTAAHAATIRAAQRAFDKRNPTPADRENLHASARPVSHENR